MQDRVREVCSKLGITQLELAKMMGVHYSTFSKWKENPPLSSELFMRALVEKEELKQELERIRSAVAVLKQL